MLDSIHRETLVGSWENHRVSKQLVNPIKNVVEEQTAGFYMFSP